MKRRKKIGGFFFLLLTGGVIAFLAWQHNASKSAGDQSSTTADGTNASSNLAPTSTYFENDAYHFSFTYLPGYVVSESDDGGVHTVVLTDASGGDALQVAISPFDEPIAELTEARIRRDLPKLVMQGVQKVTVGGIPAISFVEPSTNKGSSRETWFIFDGNLYQISALSMRKDLIDSIVSTFSVI